MNSRQTIWLAFATCLLFVSTVVGQYPNQQTFTKGEPPFSEQMYLPSPLEAGFGTSLHRLKQNLTPETRKINIGPAVASYAEIKKVEIQQARFDALEYFGAVTGKPGQLQQQGPTIQFKPIGADRYEVTAPAVYFEALPAKIRSFELGKKSIVVTIECLKLDDAVQREIRKFLTPDTISHISGEVPTVPTVHPKLDSGQGRYSASSTLQVSKSVPLTIGQLDRKNYERVMALVRSRKSCEVMTSPSVVSQPGQDALVQDGSQQPFIVGVKEIKGDFTKAHQPIIQTLENGNYFKVNCDVVEDKVSMRCSLGFAEVTQVDTVELEKYEANAALSVQSPSQLVRAINISAELGQDQILMVDPYHTTISEAKSGNKRQLQKHNVIALIRARVIDDEFKTGRASK